MTAVATRPRRRREPFFDHVRYVRRLGGRRVVQLRWWARGHGSVHLGLYADFELAAAVGRKVAAAVARRPDTPPGPLELWQAASEVLAGMRARGVLGLPRNLLPLYTYACSDGSGFGAKVRKGGRVVELPGPFPTPEEAHVAFVAHLKREFPGWRRHRAPTHGRPGRRPGRPKTAAGREVA